MKKTILGVTFILLICICGMDSVPVRAYTVTTQKDGMYAEVIPDTIINNAPALFRKGVKKALKYDRKYKDADMVTRADKIPYGYYQFIDIAKKIKASDEIVISNPFCIYTMWDMTRGDGASEFYFVAERNNKKLCLFKIYIEGDTQKIRFSYDKAMDQYFKYDEGIMKNAIFYTIDYITYAETPDKIYEVRDQKDRGSLSLTVVGEPDLESAAQKFNKKDYSEKKKQIFRYLKKNQNKSVTKKAKKSLKLELKDDYVESEDDRKDADKSKVIYPVIVIGAGGILVIAVVIFFVRKRKKSSLS